MDLLEFTDKITGLSAKMRDLKEHITTEENTKASFITPFLHILGYDTTDPRVVQFEYTADVGTKKGEKVDYAVKRDNEIIMLIEAKKVGTPLDASKANQLLRYFNATPTARLAILTDGIRYEFYSDLDKSNIMDDKPFMIFDFDNIEDVLILELKKLANDIFNIDIALSAAQDLKHVRQIKQILRKEAECPSEEFVRLFASKIWEGSLRANVLEDFKPKVRSAMSQYLNEEIILRVQGITRPATTITEPVIEDCTNTENQSQAPAIETTVEEIEAFMIVKSILRQSVPLSQVVMRDQLSYCGILFDDNNRKPICRFHFNSDRVKYLGTFDADKKETKNKIECVDDIYQYAEALHETVKQYIEE